MASAATPAARPRRALEELQRDETFVRELPADPRSDNVTRQVLHASSFPREPSGLSAAPSSLLTCRSALWSCRDMYMKQFTTKHVSRLEPCNSKYFLGLDEALHGEADEAEAILANTK